MKKKKLSLLENYIFREKKETFLFGGKKKKKQRKLPRGARFISEIRIYLFLSLFIIASRVTTTRIARSSCPIFFLYSSSFLPPPFIFRFQRLFPSFLSLSHSFPRSLSPKGGNAGKIDSNISEIVIRSRSTHCSEIDGRIYVFAWVEGRERIHREQLDRNT